MRRLIHLIPLLVLTASTAGCGSQVPADSSPPPGVVKNPVHPDPQAIQRRKLIAIDPQKGDAPSRIDGKR
ncbi:MAG TPA: hypothetical protein VH592_01865 [Gemmataceae bacterium]|jgi:hypothetical protein